MARCQKTIGIQSTVDVADTEIQAGGNSSTSTATPARNAASSVVSPPLSQHENIDYSDGYGLNSTT